MALQVTLFPNTGISIGSQFYMSLPIDGLAVGNFMRSWASLCKYGSLSLPVHDRTLISEPNKLETIYLNKLTTLNISQQCFVIQKNPPAVDPDKVLASFRLALSEVKTMETWALDLLNEMYIAAPPLMHISTFVLICAYVWVCLIKVFQATDEKDIYGLEMEHLVFSVDCRERLNPPLPQTYFGNCVMHCFVDVKRKDLIGKDGIAIAAVTIHVAIQKMPSEGVLVGARFFSIAGSPKMAFYSTDFGWEKPKKVETISLDSNGAISLSEASDRTGGLEVGLVLNNHQMKAFASLFAKTIHTLS